MKAREQDDLSSIPCVYIGKSIGMCTCLETVSSRYVGEHWDSDDYFFSGVMLDTHLCFRHENFYDFVRIHEYLL